MLTFINLQLPSCPKILNPLACVTSVSVGLGIKERPRKGIFGVLPARKMVRQPKRGKRRAGEEKEGNACRQTPDFLDFENLPLDFSCLSANTLR